MIVHTIIAQHFPRDTFYRPRPRTPKVSRLESQCK